MYQQLGLNAGIQKVFHCQPKWQAHQAAYIMTSLGSINYHKIFRLAFEPPKPDNMKANGACDHLTFRMENNAYLELPWSVRVLSESES